MTTALTTIAPRLSRLIPLLGSDTIGEVAAAAAAITRTLKQAGADWHDPAAAISHAEPLGTIAPLAWRDISESDRAAWLLKMRASRRLTIWERGFTGSIAEQLRAWPRRSLSEKQERVLDRLILKIVAEAP